MMKSSPENKRHAFTERLCSALKQYLLLNKRLLRKPSFIIILCMLPLLAAAMSVISKEDSGIITVALSQCDPHDEAASDIIRQLDETSHIIDFIICDTPEKANNEVLSGRADAAWVFEANTKENLARFASDPKSKNKIVSCLEREDNPILRVATEKLYTTVYAECTRPLYIRFARENAEELDVYSDEEMMDFYKNVNIGEELFEFSYVDSSAPTDETSRTGYLVTPLRGMLAVMMVLCGLAVSMFYLQDRERGAFVWIPRRRRMLFSAVYHLTALFDAGVIVLVALYAAGVASGFLREAEAILLYMLACTAFCIFVRRICGSIKLLGTITPVLILGFLLVCPIFMNVGVPGWVSALLPTTYYLDCVHNFAYMRDMAVYTAAVFAVDAVLYVIWDRFARKGA